MQLRSNKAKDKNNKDIEKYKAVINKRNELRMKISRKEATNVITIINVYASHTYREVEGR